MGLLTDTLLKRITSLGKKDLKGAVMIYDYTFADCDNLVSVELSDDVVEVGMYAFNGCDALQTFKFGKGVSRILLGVLTACQALADINSDALNPYCSIAGNSLTGNAWYNNHPEGSMITVAQGRILIGNKIALPSGGFEIPNTVINLASASCSEYNSVDSSFTSLIIPDTVEMIQASAFEGQTALTKITFGTGVKRITGTICPSTAIKTLVFKQPAGMNIELPTPGSANGMFYNKNSYSVNIYTDNEFIRNYGWATDNVTATFYPLSQAPA